MRAARALRNHCFLRRHIRVTSSFIFEVPPERLGRMTNTSFPSQLAVAGDRRFQIVNRLKKLVPPTAI